MSVSSAVRFAKRVASGIDSLTKNRVESGKIVMDYWKSAKDAAGRELAITQCVLECLNERVPMTKELCLAYLQDAILAERFPLMLNMRSPEFLQPFRPLVKINIREGSDAIEWHKDFNEQTVNELVTEVVNRSGRFALSDTTKGIKEVRKAITDEVRRLRGKKPIEAQPMKATTVKGYFDKLPTPAARKEAIIDMVSGIKDVVELETLLGEIRAKFFPNIKPQRRKQETQEPKQLESDKETVLEGELVTA